MASSTTTAAAIGIDNKHQPIDVEAAAAMSDDRRCLLHIEQTALPFRNLAIEVRILDQLDHALQSLAVQLDVADTSLDAIVKGQVVAC